MIKYTEKELDFIRNNYKNMTDLQIAVLLGRGIRGVYCKRLSLGLSKRIIKQQLDYLNLRRPCFAHNLVEPELKFLKIVPGAKVEFEGEDYLVLSDNGMTAEIITDPYSKKKKKLLIVSKSLLEVIKIKQHKSNKL